MNEIGFQDKNLENSEPLGLDRLPFEILRRIASLGACEAVLALSKVNKTLRAACNDRLVYKAVIENRNGFGGPEWPHHLPLTMESPVSSWARYALADSLAAYNNTSNLPLMSVVSWVPQLLAYHRKSLAEQKRALLPVNSTLLDPLIDFIDPLRLAYAVDPNRTKVIQNTDALTFCLAIRLMSGKPDRVGRRPAQGLSPVPGALTSIRYLDVLLRSQTDALFPAVCSNAMLMQKRAQAFVAVGFFAVALREASENRLARLPYGRQPQIAAITVPTSNSIPFHMLMDVPLPFSPSAVTEFASCHLAKMTTIDFLEDGEWVGYYSLSVSHNRRSRPALFDPPMHGIRFVATAIIDSPATLNLHATGEDAHGHFELEGKLEPETGHILLKKTYSGGFPVWDWVCFMTPVGIVGSWGRSDRGGWIWLWKTGWTASHPS